MDQKKVEKEMRTFVGGASFITVQQLIKYLGKSRNTTQRLIETVPAIEGRLYFIPDVAEALSHQCTNNGGN